MARASKPRNTKDVDAIRDDIEALKNDLGNLVKHVGSTAAGRAEQLCGDLRNQGADALRTQVRDLPITSMVIAFIAGTVAANIMRR